MSRWNDKADRIATYLAAQPELRWIPVSVHRDDNLLQLVQQKVSKNSGGGCVIIKWLGGANPDRKSSALRIGARFSISLWTRKVIDDEMETPADDLIEALAERLHGWVDATPGALVHRLEVTGVELVPDAPGYIVHEILAEISRI